MLHIIDQRSPYSEADFSKFVLFASKRLWEMKFPYIWRTPRRLTLKIAKTSLPELMLNIFPFGTSEDVETDSGPPFEGLFKFCKVCSQENNTFFAPNSWRTRKICGNQAQTSIVEKKQKGNKKM